MEKENLGFVLVNEEKKHNNNETVAKEKKEEKKSFYCHVCGAETYHKVTKSSGILGPGGWGRTLYYVCDGCSVLFEDPEKFSN